MKTCMRFLSITNGQIILCDKKNHLTTNYFIDTNNPENPDIAILCQIHKNDIIRPILRPYLIKINEIEIEKSNIKKTTKKSNQYEIIFVPQIKTRLDMLYKEKNQIVFNFCRDLLCNNEGSNYTQLDYTNLFSLLLYNENGKLEHCLYFHKTCWNRMKRVFGLHNYKPDNHSLDNFISC